jgi:hypothetical protein
MKRCGAACWIFVGCVATLVPPCSDGASVETPTILTCTSNAKASRDYEFSTKKWAGEKGHTLHPAQPFDISIKGRERRDDIIRPLRDKIFSGLDTNYPTVRSITRFKEGDEQAQEFTARVVSRAFDTVFLSWTNDPPHNKMWLAAVNVKHRKAVVVQVFEGVTSLGGEVETLDCR